MNTRPSARRSLPLWLGVLLSALLSALAACSDSPPPAPVINAQPTDTSATAGSAATLSVGASGPDLAYQRQQSTDAGSTWTNIAGATQANHATAAITPADSGKRFRAVASNASGHANSNAALLTVSAAAPAPSGSGKLAAAFRHTCAIKSDATLNCWGYNSSAQLGSGDRNRYWAPNPVAGRFTDPSYHLPAFYELWARWSDNASDRAFWSEAANVSRAFFVAIFYILCFGSITEQIAGALSPF